jgi:hypothetical protein
LKIVNKDPAIINRKEISIASYFVSCNARDKCHAASAALAYQEANNPIAFVTEVDASNLNGVI